MLSAPRHWLALTLVATLVACGGGGGASGTSSAGTATPANPSAPPVSTTGLVPAAPAVGASLYADAGVLRPLRDGGAWKYRGTAVAGPGIEPITYLTTTSQVSTVAGAATETSTNAANGGSVSTALSIVAGQVSNSQPVDFAGKGTPEPLKLIELRSPVREGDQVTILDRHYTDTAIDADGDGKTDALDVGVYSKVIGIEAVVLPNLPAVQAVRVDTVVLSRVIYSSNGQMSPVVQGTQQTWYAAGVGIVRQTTSTPTASNNGVATTDEMIVSWDGGTSGFGAMETLSATIPATSGVYPGQKLPADLSASLSAFAFGDHALVVTTTPDITTTGTLVSTVDLRGRVTGTQLLQGNSSPLMVRALRDGLVLVNRSCIDGVDCSLVRVDASGAVVGSADGAPVRLSGAHVSSQVTRLAVAADDSTLWFLWTRDFYDPGGGRVPGSELVLRAFSPAGEALGPEQIVDTGNVLYPEISAAGGRALLTWAHAQSASTSYPPYDVFYREASLAALGPTQVFAQGLNAAPFLTPLRLAADGAILWKSAIGSNANLGTSSGIRLDAALQPLRAGASFVDEQIPGLPPFDAVAVAPLSGSARLLAVATQPGSLWPNVDGNQVQSLGWMDLAGATPLATLPVQTVRFAYVQPTAVIGFADRALVFGSDYASRLTTTVVWLNNGSAPH